MNKSVLPTLVILVLACIMVPLVSAAQGASTDSSTNYTVQKLYTDLKNPWGIAWLPDGRMLVTERSGEILVFKNDQYTGQKLLGVPSVFNEGQGGLLDIAVHPDYAKNNWIY